MKPAALFIASISICGAFLAIPGCPPAPTDQDDSIPGTGTPLDRAIDLLQVEARSTEPDIRANCIESLQPLLDERALNVIGQGLHDNDWLVRFASAMAAGHRNAFSLKPILQTMAVTDTSPNVQVAAIFALNRLGDSTNMSRLNDTLNSTDVSVRANTALALGILGEKSAIPLLLAHAGEAEPRAKFEIAAALARLGDPSGLAALESFSISKYVEDRIFAMAAWPDVDSPDAADVLLSGLQDPMPGLRDRTRETELAAARIRLTAARGLGKLGNRAGLHGAVALTNDSAPEIRSLAALALGDILNPSEEHILLRMMGDSNERVRVAAASALVELHTRNRIHVAATEPTTQH